MEARMAYKDIVYTVENKVLTITLNRPDRLNAVTVRMGDELKDAFDRSDGDDTIRAVIVTGNGRAFCAGADLESGGETFDFENAKGAVTAATHRDEGGIIALRIFDSIKPVIAAINGPAVGFGATMTLPMDIRIASDKARCGFVFTRRGIVPEACSTWFLPRIVGISQAAEWVYSGRIFSAEEALKGGLVRSIHAPNDLLVVANDLAREIADNTSAVSVALSRQMMWRMLGADHPMEAHKLDSRGMFFTGKSADAREGILSFLEKRAPNFTNKPSTDMPEFYPWWEARDFK